VYIYIYIQKHIQTAHTHTHSHVYAYAYANENTYNFDTYEYQHAYHDAPTLDDVGVLFMMLRINQHAAVICSNALDETFSSDFLHHPPAMPRTSKPSKAEG